jgi:hypothetical protein
MMDDETNDYFSILNWNTIDANYEIVKDYSFNSYEVIILSHYLNLIYLIVIYTGI